MKLSIVYDTRTGNTARMAEYIMEGMLEVEGAEARAFALDAVDEQYVRDSAALVVGTPTYNGTYTARLKPWIESAPGRLGVGLFWGSWPWQPAKTSSVSGLKNTHKSRFMGSSVGRWDGS